MGRQRRTRRTKRELDVPESTRGRRLFNYFRPPRTFRFCQTLACLAMVIEGFDDAVVEGIGGPSFICGSLATDEKLAG